MDLGFKVGRRQLVARPINFGKTDPSLKILVKYNIALKYKLF